MLHKEAVIWGCTLLNLYTEGATKTKERSDKSVLAFFEDCISLFGEKLSTNLGDLPIDDGKLLYHYEMTTKTLFRKIFVDYHRLLLYLKPDEELLKAASEVIAHILLIEKVFRKHTTTITLALKAAMRAHIDNDKRLYRECVDKSDTVREVYSKELLKPLNDFRKSFMSYISQIQRYLSIDRNSLLKDIAEQTTRHV